MSISMPTPSKQQNHAELAEDAESLVGTDEAEDRRPDDDTGDDLAHDRGHIDPLRDLSSDFRCDEHDEDVEEDCPNVHKCGRGSVGAVGALQ